MVIIEFSDRTKVCLDGSLIEIPKRNSKVWANGSLEPTQDFKDWMRVNCGHYAKNTAAYTTHNMGWCVVPFAGMLRDHTAILVRHPEKLMLIKLAWF